MAFSPHFPEQNRGRIWAWIICEATNLIFLCAFIAIYIKGSCTSNPNKDHSNLQIMRLCLVFALVCQSLYPIQFIIDDFHGHSRDSTYTCKDTCPYILALAVFYDIIMPTILTVIVIRIFQSYRALFHPVQLEQNRSVSMSGILSSTIPLRYLIPTFLWCFSTYVLATLQFLHFAYIKSVLFENIFYTYCLIWAVFEFVFLIQLLFILGRLQWLLRAQYRYKKTLEASRIENGHSSKMHLDSAADRYYVMMKTMIVRMRRLIIGFSAYFVFVEGTYLWIAIDDFDENYNSVCWIVFHTTLGHVAMHCTLLYYVRIRDSAQFDVDDTFSFEIVADSIGSNPNNGELKTPIVCDSDYTPNNTIGSSVFSAAADAADSEDLRKYEQCYKIRFDVSSNESH
eukprot:28829_1